MADANYLSPIQPPAKAGVQIDVITINRVGPSAHVGISEVDANGNIVASHVIDVVANSPNAATATRDFVSALFTPVSGEPAGVLQKLNRRCVKYLASLNVFNGATD